MGPPLASAQHSRENLLFLSLRSWDGFCLIQSQSLYQGWCGQALYDCRLLPLTYPLTSSHTGPLHRLLPLPGRLPPRLCRAGAYTLFLQILTPQSPSVRSPTPPLYFFTDTLPGTYFPYSTPECISSCKSHLCLLIPSVRASAGLVETLQH